MTDKVDANTRSTNRTKVIVALLVLAGVIAGGLFAYFQWYAEEHHDLEDGHHGQEQVAPANQDRPGAVRKK